MTGSSRRQFVTAAAAVGATTLLDAHLGSKAFAAASAKIDMKLMPSQQKVWADVEYMNNLGARYCGNPAHMKFMDFLDRELKACGATLSDIEHTSLVQWLPRKVTLATKAGPLPVGAFARWSAVTGPQGVTAPLCYIGRADGPSRFAVPLFPDKRSKIEIPADVRGKIALIEVAATQRPLDRMFKDSTSFMFDKEAGQPLPALQGPSASNQTLLPDGLEERLKAAGALGLILAWINLSDEDAKGQARLGTEFLPSLWVVPSTGKALRELADEGEPVTLTVEADISPHAPTRTIVATLPGMTEESIILWTHTDGQNAIEENGAVALLNMVRYFSKLPKTSRQRTIVVVMPEGHFAEQYVPTSAWIKERPELVAKSVALIAAEHMGCMEWLSDPVANTYKPTGKAEVAYAFCPTRPVQRLAKDAVVDQGMGREVILATQDFAFTPGIAAYRTTKLPTFAYISIPNYLLSDNANGHIAKLSPTLFYEQMKMLTRLVHGIDATPTAVLRAT